MLRRDLIVRASRPGGRRHCWRVATAVARSRRLSSSPDRRRQGSTTWFVDRELGCHRSLVRTSREQIDNASDSCYERRHVPDHIASDLNERLLDEQAPTSRAAFVEGPNMPPIPFSISLPKPLVRPLAFAVSALSRGLEIPARDASGGALSHGPALAPVSQRSRPAAVRRPADVGGRGLRVVLPRPLGRR